MFGGKYFGSGSNAFTTSRDSFVLVYITDANPISISDRANKKPGIRRTTVAAAFLLVVAVVRVSDKDADADTDDKQRHNRKSTIGTIQTPPGWRVCICVCVVVLKRDAVGFDGM